eukprot:3611031-Rhodomonas_salina.1
MLARCYIFSLLGQGGWQWALAPNSWFLCRASCTVLNHHHAGVLEFIRHHDSGVLSTKSAKCQLVRDAIYWQKSALAADEWIWKQLRRRVELEAADS